MLHRSTSTYFASYIYHQPLPQSKKFSKSAQIAIPGSQNLALERRNGPNPCDRCIGEPWWAHKTATEDKCDSSWAYLSSYIYRQPLPESKRMQKLPRTTPRSQNLALDRRNGPNPSDRCIGTPMGVHKMDTEDNSVISWAYLSSYIYHEPLPESKKSRNLPRSRPPGAKTFPLRVKYMSKPWSRR